jgi:DnaK suppressor protein
MTKTSSINTAYFKEKLEKEKKLIEGELRSVGRINPENPRDWEATPSPIDVMPADKTEVAEQVEEFEERTAVEVELENKLNSIKKALKRIEEGSYGVCEVGGEPIEEARLEANPAATTCLKHLNK